jgi:integrase
MLHKAPAIEMPKRANTGKMMKGRPVTAEEFDRMIDKTKAEVGESRAKSWQRDLDGLWLSGLRLSEAIELSWDDESTLHVVMNGKYPMLRIPAEGEKGHKERLLPITPDFAEWLAQTPQEARCGRVFRFVATTGKRYTERFSAGRVVSSIGERAGVKVSTKKAKDGSSKVKFASAHDLRRSFGERWARKVMPQVLMELMRHESMETTLKYYVGTNAEATASVLWTTTGNTSGNSRPSHAKSQSRHLAVSR